MKIVDKIRSLRSRRAFVFSAGGALGAFQVGQIKAVLAAGIVPDVLIGVSAGSLNASFLSSDPSFTRAELLGELWQTDQITSLMDESFFQRSLRIARRQPYLYGSEPLEKVIDDLCKYCNPDLVNIEDANTELHILACDLLSGSDFWFDSGPARIAMLASSTVPGMLRPVEYGDKLLIDGGVHTPLPVRKAAELGCREIWAFSVPRLNKEGVEDLSALGVFLRSFTIARWAGSEAPLAPGITVHHLPTPVVAGSSPTAFKRVREFMEAGEESAEEYLEQLLVDETIEPSLRERLQAWRAEHHLFFPKTEEVPAS